MDHTSIKEWSCCTVERIEGEIVNEGIKSIAKVESQRKEVKVTSTLDKTEEEREYDWSSWRKACIPNCS